MRILILWVGVMCCGCSTYTEAQMRLVEQARRGVALCAESQNQTAQLATILHDTQRARLDEAFDTDVREQAQLSADWIIEHRQAYATALSALERQRAASQDAQAQAQRNFQAIDDALKRVLDLQTIQLKLETAAWPKQGRGLAALCSRNYQRRELS